MAECNWTDLRDRHYTITSDTELGFPGFAKAIIERFYGPDVLTQQGDTQGPVADRWRAKDMCLYSWGDSGCWLTSVAEEYVRIGTRPSARQVPRLDFLSLPGAYAFVAALLALVPPEQRRPRGTFGVHAFRSFGQVVNGPHQDGFEFGITYVLDRVGGGAVSYLIQGGQHVLDYQLQPGEILLFRDSEFSHGATALDGDGPHRDALVIQFNAPEDLEAAADREGAA